MSPPVVVQLSSNAATRLLRAAWRRRDVAGVVRVLAPAAATLVVSEVLRQLHGGSLSQLIDMDLLAIEHRTVVAQKRDFSTFNPGYFHVPTKGFVV